MLFYRYDGAVFPGSYRYGPAYVGAQPEAASGGWPTIAYPRKRRRIERDDEPVQPEPLQATPAITRAQITIQSIRASRDAREAQSAAEAAEAKAILDAATERTKRRRRQELELLMLM